MQVCLEQHAAVRLKGSTAIIVFYPKRALHWLQIETDHQAQVRAASSCQQQHIAQHNFVNEECVEEAPSSHKKVT